MPPEHYQPADFNFIVPRALELTYTSHDLLYWAQDLGYTGGPFVFNPERRVILRAELRYILDPAEVMGDDYPSETFRVFKNNEMREFGKYRTQRLALEAWDRL